MSRPNTNSNQKEFEYQSIEEVPADLDENNFKITNGNLSLTKLEYHRLKVFENKHKICGRGRCDGAIGVGPSITFSYNSIGRSVAVKCPHCGITADITNYDIW